MDRYRALRRAAARRLWGWLDQAHWNGEAIAGPDPIGKLNWRVWRFIKAYLPQYPWRDTYAYEQTQGYWVRANLGLYRLDGDTRYLTTARQTADAMVRRQRPDGAWNYPPLRERRGRLATVEGSWAALGLVAAYREFHSPQYLLAAIKWSHFVELIAKLLEVNGGLSVRYYPDAPAVVPNVSTIYLWLLAELHDLTGERRHLELARGILHFLASSQLPTGELPYEVKRRPHFMCFQYNAFQFLDLAGYWLLTRDGEVRAIMRRLAMFLSDGLAPSGAARYSCFKPHPEVNYWTAALAAALHVANQLGLLDWPLGPAAAFDRLLKRQNADGSFDYSSRNYVVLRDQRSYPRPQAMILGHLVLSDDLGAWYANAAGAQPSPLALSTPEHQNGHARY